MPEDWSVSSHQVVMESFTSSYHHNRSLNGAPLGRIVVTGSKILYRNREYTSASEALGDYISEFECGGQKFKSSNSHRKAKDVLDLLSTGHSHQHDRKDPPDETFGTSNGPLQADVSRLSLRELRLSSSQTASNDTLQISRASIEESYRRMREVDDAIEVAHTLNQSYDVLKKVEEDRLSQVGEVPSRSDLQSLATESLISVDPYPVISDEVLLNVSQARQEPHKGHVYSYRTPRSRAHTVAGISFSGRTNGLTANFKGALKSHVRNSEMGNPSNTKPVLGGSLPDARLGRQPLVNKSNLASGTRYRSRSVSPKFDGSKFYPEVYSRSSQVPSWLEDLDMSRESKQSNLANFRDLRAVRTPSWIEDIVGSTTSSVTQSEAELISGVSEMSAVSSSSVLIDSKPSGASKSSVLRTSQLDFNVAPTSRRSGKDRISNSAYVHTSTPLHKNSVKTSRAKYSAVNGLPDRFRLAETSSMEGRTVSSISTSDSRLNRNVGGTSDMHVDYAENNDKIGKMLKELDLIKTKLKSSSDDTHNCIRELTSAQGADNFESSESQNPVKRLFHVHRGEDSQVASHRLENIEQGHHPRLPACPELKVSSPTSSITNNILQGDRPWERPRDPLCEDVRSEREQVLEDRELYVSRKPGVIGDFLNDCLQQQDKQTKQEESHDTVTLSGGSQPGSMEALKNMLFKLQSEASVNQDNKSEHRDMALQGRELQQKSSKTDEEDEGIDPARVSEDADFHNGPGAQSLERALAHLSRLKTLVQGSAFNPEPRNNSTPNTPSSSS